MEKLSKSPAAKPAVNVAPDARDEAQDAIAGLAKCTQSTMPWMCGVRKRLNGQTKYVRFAICSFVGCRGTFLPLFLLSVKDGTFLLDR